MMHLLVQLENGQRFYFTTDNAPESKKARKVCPWSKKIKCVVDHIYNVHPNNAEVITYDSYFTKYEGRLALIISKKYQEWFPNTQFC